MNAPVLRLEEPVRHRFTVFDVRRMVEAGVIDPDARIELIDGELIDMPSEGETHLNYKAELNNVFVLGLAPERRFRVIPDATLHLSATDAPEPDLYIVESGAPLEPVEPSTVALVIEVADASVTRDLHEKPTLYARYGLREYWVIDVQRRVTHVHQSPRGGIFGVITAVSFNEELRPLFLRELALRIADLPYLDPV